jgi:CubicO group peptidase (beta-lactamase class C family)
MKSKFILILLVLSTVLMSCTSVSHKRADLQSDLDSLIKASLEQSGVTGLAVSIIDDGKIIISQGYGDSRLMGEPSTLTKDTLFQIGSITKIVTAMAVMNLVEEGIVDPDADIREYLKDFHPKMDFVNDGSITIRDLLTHQSGLPSTFLSSFILEEPESDKFMNTSSLLSEEYMVWESGKSWAYNNTGFSLLGELIGTVSGLSYVQYVEEMIFQPLGLKNAQVYLSDRHDPMVSGGFTAGEAEELMIIKDLPAGSILFSAEHMSIFMKELIDCSMGFSDKILRTETLNSMFAAQNSNVELDDGFEIGLTFWIDSFKGKKTVGHGGTIPPFYSEMKLVPEEGIGVFLNSNDNVGDNGFLHALENEILSLLIEDEKNTPSIVLPQPIPEKNIHNYEGYYTVGAFGMFQLTVEKDELIAELPQMGIHSPVIFTPGNNLLIRDLGISLIPTDTEGAAFFCYMEDMFLGPVAKVLPEEIDILWTDREGRYVSDDFVKAITLSFDKDAGIPVLDIEFLGTHLPLAIAIRSNNLLQVQGYGRNQGNLLEYKEKDSTEYLKYAGITFIREN